MASDQTSEAIGGRGFTEGLDVLLGVLGGHVGVVWRAKRAAGGPSERSEFTSGVLYISLYSSMFHLSMEQIDEGLDCQYVVCHRIGARLDN